MCCAQELPGGRAEGVGDGDGVGACACGVGRADVEGVLREGPGMGSDVLAQATRSVESIEHTRGCIGVV